MRLKNYREDLLERLKDPDYAAEYLAQVLAEKDKAAFLVALNDVVEATGGMSAMAKRVGLKRPSLYKVFSKRGNPTLETLQAILEADSRVSSLLPMLQGQELPLRAEG